jgi:hypothetical protein
MIKERGEELSGPRSSGRRKKNVKAYMSTEEMMDCANTFATVWEG